MRYLLRVKDADSGAIVSERQFRSRADAISLYDKAESAVVLDLVSGKLIAWK